jgi:hypothetical protein
MLKNTHYICFIINKQTIKIMSPDKIFLLQLANKVIILCLILFVIIGNYYVIKTYNAPYWVYRLIDYINDKFKK